MPDYNFTAKLKQATCTATLGGELLNVPEGEDIEALTERANACVLKTLPTANIVSMRIWEKGGKRA